MTIITLKQINNDTDSAFTGCVEGHLCDIIHTSSDNMVSDIYKAFSISIYYNLMVGVGTIYEA